MSLKMNLGRSTQLPVVLRLGKSDDRAPRPAAKPATESSAAPTLPPTPSRSILFRLAAPITSVVVVGASVWLGAWLANRHDPGVHWNDAAAGQANEAPAGESPATIEYADTSASTGDVEQADFQIETPPPAAAAAHEAMETANEAVEPPRPDLPQEDQPAPTLRRRPRKVGEPRIRVHGVTPVRRTASNGRY